MYNFREDLMPNLEEARKALNKQDESVNEELQEVIRNMKK